VRTLFTHVYPCLPRAPRVPRELGALGKVPWWYAVRKSPVPLWPLSASATKRHPSRTGHNSFPLRATHSRPTAEAVDYDQAWDEIVGGRGTSTLVLKGRRIAVNARALSGASIDVSETGWRDTRDALNLTLMPGRHSINVPAAAYNYAYFTLEFEDGTIDYDSDMDHVLAGRGTATLLIRGTVVFVDARGIQDTSIVVDSFAWMPTRHILPLVLMPGKHSIQRVTASGGLSLSYFDVMNDGKLNYDPNADILFEGRNTNTLRLRQ
jgi:hypothetical protein